MPDPTYSDEQLDAAIEAISDPQRLRLAEDLVARSAPALRRVLAAALQDGEWFGSAHEEAVRDAVAEEDPHDREAAVRRLLAEETQLGMFVGVAVGFELARELGTGPAGPAARGTGSAS